MKFRNNMLKTDRQILVNEKSAILIKLLKEQILL